MSQDFPAGIGSVRLAHKTLCCAHSPHSNDAHFVARVLFLLTFVGSISLIPTSRLRKVNAGRLCVNTWLWYAVGSSARCFTRRQISIDGNLSFLQTTPDWMLLLAHFMRLTQTSSRTSAMFQIACDSSRTSLSLAARLVAIDALHLPLYLLLIRKNVCLALWV